MSRPPVFILGAPRSGTSLLYKALCLHPDAVWISNYVRRVPGLPQAAVLNRLARRAPRLTRAVWFGADSNAYVYGAKRSLAHRLMPMPTEGEPVFRSRGILEDPAEAVGSAGVRNDSIRRAFDVMARWAGGDVVVSKRIGHNRRVPLLHSAFPKARFVHLVRDGRAVAFSLSTVDWWQELTIWWYGGTPVDWAREGRDPWELCARHWLEEVRAVDNGLRSVPADQVLTVAYEELVAAPVPTLDKIRAFSGLDSDPVWAEELGALRFPDNNERWRRALSPDERQRIESVQADELVRRGYPV